MLPSDRYGSLTGSEEVGGTVVRGLSGGHDHERTGGFGVRVRLTLLGCVLVLVSSVGASLARADNQTLVGFVDDPSFRWHVDSGQMLKSAAGTGAAIIRTTAYWSQIAPTRPANATNPFDPAYQFTDLDQLVRTAALDDMTVLLTIWETPGWANHNKGVNYAPTQMSDLREFAQALAARYSGRYPGFPFVGYYSLWNEPNLNQFLAPTFVNGKPASPAIYARMARATYAGIKASNRLAQVAIGETSPRGRDKPSPSPGKVEDTLSPGTFARLVAQAPGPRVRFDAWAQHPYSDLGEGPLQKVRFPNVDLPQLPTFETDLDKWFKRKGVPIWITEYGFQTKPGQPKGVTDAQQAAYITQTFAVVRRDQRVKMFAWFIFRDDPTSAWHSGLLNEDGTPKPSLSPFTIGAHSIDARNVQILVKPGASNPDLRIPVWALAARDGVGAKLGATISVTYGKKTTVSQPTSTIAIDGSARFRLPITKARLNGLYVAHLIIGDANGDSLTRTATILVR
jgi:hypothetical protein